MAHIEGFGMKFAICTFPIFYTNEKILKDLSPPNIAHSEVSPCCDIC